MRFVIAIGSTVVDGVRRGIAGIDLRILGRSRTYTTPAAGGVTSLPFENAAIVVDTALHPAALLAHLHSIEARAGRVRGERDAARALDLDLVWGLDVVAPLTFPAIPHPRALSRAFVVVPACEALEAAGIGVPMPLREARRRAPPLVVR